MLHTVTHFTWDNPEDKCRLLNLQKLIAGRCRSNFLELMDHGILPLQPIYQMSLQLSRQYLQAKCVMWMCACDGLTSHLGYIPTLHPVFPETTRILTRIKYLIEGKWILRQQVGTMGSISTSVPGSILNSGHCMGWWIFICCVYIVFPPSPKTYQYRN